MASQRKREVWYSSNQNGAGYTGTERSGERTGSIWIGVRLQGAAQQC